MPLINALIAALAWLGRQGTRALAASILVGLSLPQLAVYLKPYLGETVFVLLLFSFLRTDPEAFRRYLTAPKLTIVVTLWAMVVLPLAAGFIYTAAGLRESNPDLYTVMILHAAIAPITSSAAFAALIGLDVALTLLSLIMCSLVAPITTVAMSYYFLGTALFTPLELGSKLFFFIAASGAVAFVIRRVIGQAALVRHREPIDGLNVIGSFAFAIVAMSPVSGFVAANPWLSVKLMGLVVLIALVMIAVTMLVFIRLGASRALAVALVSSFRNLGLIMGAIGSTLPELAWFYFALVQFPVYLMPVLLKPLARHFAEKR